MNFPHLLQRDFELDTRRAKFDHKQFAQEHGLEGPIASLFFWSQPAPRSTQEPASST